MLEKLVLAAAGSCVADRGFTGATNRSRRHRLIANPLKPTPALNSVVRNNDTFGVLRLVLRPGGYSWRFVPQAGKSFTDSGTASCH